MLERPTTTLTPREKRNGTAAEVNYDDNFPPAYVKIEIDMNNQSPIRLIVHELLHVVLSELVIGKFDETLEEVVIVALDGYLWNYIQSSKQRTARWTKLIDKKLAEHDAKLIPVKHEELVDRKQYEPK